MRTILPTFISIACLLACGCRKSPPAPAGPSPRIVSFSPALTDILYDMGLGEHVVGITTFCQPPGGSRPPIVGDRGRVNAEAILAVRPDMLLVQQNPEDFGALRSLAPQVRIEYFEIETLAAVAAAVQRVGELAGQPETARARRSEFEQKMQDLRSRLAGREPVATLLVMDYERPSTGGAGTFIDEMITLAGGVNAAAARGYNGWKTLNRENILAMAPQVLICQVPSGQEAAAREYWQSLPSLPAVAAGRVHVVTDVRWTIPSLRSVDYAAELAAMIHPGAFGEEQERE